MPNAKLEIKLREAIADRDAFKAEVDRLRAECAAMRAVCEAAADSLPIWQRDTSEWQRLREALARLAAMEPK